MTKRRTAFLLCLTLLLFSAAPGPGRAGYSPGAQEEEEDKPPLSLPGGRGAWLLELSRSGGMRPTRQTVSINSDGEVAIRTEHYVAGGKPVVDCSLKVKLSAGDLLRLKEAVRSSQPAAWRDGYSDKEHPICCDQPTTRLTLRRRGARATELRYGTSWYPGSSRLRPADLAGVAEVAQELWNKASENCEATSAGE